MYDEETQQFSEDVVDAVGKVASLTKVASNNFHGISLFTDASQTQYKNIVDYLREISEIMDELDDKSKQALLENLFGKMRANIGSALLSNYEKVDEALEKMAEADGDALREIDTIQSGIEFSLNQLKQTLVGIAQNNITQDFLKNIINDVTRLLEVIERSETTLRPLFSIIEGITSLVASFSEQLGALGTVVTAISLKNAVKGTGRDRMSSLIEYARCDVVVTLNELCV